jgi:hypothetical protein
MGATMTGAPLSAAKTIPFTMFASVPVPLGPSTRTGSSRQFGQVPAPPTALCVFAAAVPATCVECPCSSVAFESLETKSCPGSTLPARSGWEAQTPVPTTAMTVPAPPRVMSQAS